MEKKRNIRYKDPYNSKRLFAMFVTLLFYIIMCTFRRIYQICLKCIAYIAGQKIECRKLKLEIAAILIRKKHYNLFSNNQYKVKTSVVKKALEEYENILSQQFIIKLNDNAEPIVDEDEPAIPTESNPKPDVLKEITQIIGLDYENMFKAREPFIDRELLNPRHNIVHGRRRVPNYNEVIEVTNYVLEIMETYKESVYSLAEKEDYLK